jgi:hypothetical protein
MNDDFNYYFLYASEDARNSLSINYLTYKDIIQLKTQAYTEFQEDHSYDHIMQRNEYMVNMMVELNKYKSRNLNSYNPYTDTFNHKRLYYGDDGYS